MSPDIVAALAELERIRDSRAMVYAVDRIETPHTYVLYECLRTLGRGERLDVVLCTGGGDVDAARRIALLLLEYAGDLRILVPDHAESAGTLVCLSARELILGPMAQLGPLDPHISEASAHEPGGPSRISAEDVRVLPRVAREWFGLDEAAEGAQAFGAMTRRIFPTTLSSFYRADRNIRRAGRELFAHQRPDLTPEDRAQVVDRLVEGFDSHGHVITRGEARELGLRVSHPTPEEEELMWACVRPLHHWQTRASDSEEATVGLIASGTGFYARQTYALDAPGGLPRLYWELPTPAKGGGERHVAAL